MIRSARGSAVGAMLALAALVAASALPADAAFKVEEHGKTVTITQLDTTRLVIERDYDGALVVDDGVTELSYPPPTNLVVRGSDALAASNVVVVLNSPLPGALTLDLPGTSEVTVSGSDASIGCSRSRAATPPRPSTSAHRAST
jgi:hypothetical protein